MFKRTLVAVLLCLAAQALYAAAPEITGEVVEIAGQRVTLKDTEGKRTTISVAAAATLVLGERVRIEYAPVGDALRAISVTKLPN